MKYISTAKNLLVFVQLLFAYSALGWGTDKVISPYGPSAQHSMAAKQNGVLFAALPGVGIVGPNIVTVYTSTDNGDTWAIAPVGGLPVTSPVLKTKMAVTSLDSVYCLFIQDNQVYILNVESGTLGQFNTTGVDDFDAAASSSGNWIYLFVDEPGSNSIKRYGTVDGGQTWTGNTATVTSNGAQPRICMSGTLLILNYYGPVLPDTATSVIRAAFYNESAPGNLAPGTFQDVALATGVKRQQYQTVLNNGTAWFIFTEGDAQQVVKCRSSIDDGVTYQTEFTITGDINVNAFWFGAASYSNVTGNGITLTCLADSIAPVGTAFAEMVLFSSTTISPNTFVSPAVPFNTYNDTAVTSSATDVLPILIHYAFGAGAEIGIAWMGESPQGPWLYFDRLSATVGLNESTFPAFSLNMYPSPASDMLTVQLNGIFSENITMEAISAEGRIIHSQFVETNPSLQQYHVPVHLNTFSSGNYVLKIVSGSQVQYRKFTVSK